MVSGLFRKENIEFSAKTRLDIKFFFSTVNSKTIKGFNIGHIFLPARASKQGNVIRLVSVYMYIYLCTKKL